MKQKATEKVLIKKWVVLGQGFIHMKYEAKGLKKKGFLKSCEIICGSPMTLAVKGLMMIIMVFLKEG